MVSAILSLSAIEPNHVCLLRTRGHCADVGPGRVMNGVCWSTEVRKVNLSLVACGLLMNQIRLTSL